MSGFPRKCVAGVLPIRGRTSGAIDLAVAVARAVATACVLRDVMVPEVPNFVLPFQVDHSLRRIGSVAKWTRKIALRRVSWTKFELRFRNE